MFVFKYRYPFLQVIETVGQPSAHWRLYSCLPWTKLLGMLLELPRIESKMFIFFCIIQPCVLVLRTKTTRFAVRDHMNFSVLLASLAYPKVEPSLPFDPRS